MSEGLKPGWRRVKFGEVVHLSKESSKDPAVDGLERYVGLEHIDPGDLRIRSWGAVKDGTTFTRRFRPGQVLFGKRRAYQRKVAVAGSDGVCSGDIYVFESKDPETLLPDLLPFICQTDAFFEYAVGTSAGSLSPRTNWKSLAKYEFALPPLEEQRDLVKVLSIHAQLHDGYVECLDAATSLHRTTSWTIFRRLGLGEKVHLGDLVIHSAFGPRFPGNLYSGKGNVHTIRTTDFIEGGGISLDTAPAVILEKKVYSKHVLSDGDFLLSRSGEYAGMVRVYRQRVSNGRILIPAAFLIRFRLEQSRLLPDYLAEYCESPQGKAVVRSMAMGSAQPNISGSKFKAMIIPLPSLHQQEQVVQQLHTIHAAEHALKRRMHESRKNRAFLMKRLFGGVA